MHFRLGFVALFFVTAALGLSCGGSKKSDAISTDGASTAPARNHFHVDFAGTNHLMIQACTVAQDLQKNAIATVEASSDGKHPSWKLEFRELQCEFGQSTLHLPTTTRECNSQIFQVPVEGAESGTLCLDLEPSSRAYQPDGTDAIVIESEDGARFTVWLKGQRLEQFGPSTTPCNPGEATERRSMLIRE